MVNVQFKEASEGETRKRHCEDCRFCQFCSDDRCRACCSGRRERSGQSLADQIARYDELNRHDPIRPDRPLRLI